MCDFTKIIVIGRIVWVKNTLKITYNFVNKLKVYFKYTPVLFPHNGMVFF